MEVHFSTQPQKSCIEGEKNLNSDYLYRELHNSETWSYYMEFISEEARGILWPVKLEFSLLFSRGV